MSLALDERNPITSAALPSLETSRGSIAGVTTRRMPVTVRSLAAAAFAATCGLPDLGCTSNSTSGTARWPVASSIASYAFEL